MLNALIVEELGSCRSSRMKFCKAGWCLFVYFCDYISMISPETLKEGNNNYVINCSCWSWVTCNFYIYSYQRKTYPFTRYKSMKIHSTFIKKKISRCSLDANGCLLMSGDTTENLRHRTLLSGSRLASSGGRSLTYVMKWWCNMKGFAPVSGCGVCNNLGYL